MAEKKQNNKNANSTIATKEKVTPEKEVKKAPAKTTSTAKTAKSKTTTTKKTTAESKTTKTTKTTKPKTETSKVASPKVTTKSSKTTKATSTVKPKAETTKEEKVEDVEFVEEKKEVKEETKERVVSLNQIKDAIYTRVNDNQKRNIVKQSILNIFIAIIMVAFLVIILFGNKNIDKDILIQDLKFITICITSLGIILMERAYKKDSIAIAANAVEVIIFSIINLCIVYVIELKDLKSIRLLNIISIISTAIALYYIVKTIVMSVRNTRLCKKKNNDIKEIVKKKKRVDD